MVYQIALHEPLVLVPVDVAAAGAYAIFLERGTGEVTTALASTTGAVLVAGAEEGAAAGEDGGEGDGHEHENGPATATGSQWANALGASLVVSACRWGQCAAERMCVCGGVCVSELFSLPHARFIIVPLHSARSRFFHNVIGS